MDAFNEDQEPAAPQPLQKPEVTPAAAPRTRWGRSLLSLLVYVGIYLLLFQRDLPALLILLAVILIHEAGHYLAMRAFGYQDLQVFFIPLMGAFVSGQPTRISQRERAITLLAGPLPGILVGMICWLLYLYLGQSWLLKASLLFMLLNAFNLLPVSPLDGGQLLETLLGKRSVYLQLSFVLLSILVVVLTVMLTRNYFLLVLILLLVLRLSALLTRQRWRNRLQRDGYNLQQDYSSLSQAEYAGMRNSLARVIPAWKGLDPDHMDEEEHEIAATIRNLLDPVTYHDLGWGARLAIALCWLAGLLLPLLLVLGQGWLYPFF